MNKIEEFKSFVKTKPVLITYVRNGKMTWQQFYELWYLYGPNHEEWNKYGTIEEKETTKQEGFSLADVFNTLKRVDMDSVRKNISGIQKAIGLIQDITSKGDSSKVETKEPYKPRPIYRRFED